MHNLGKGYPKYAAELLKNRCCDPELTNLGIGGNKAEDLAARWEADFISLNPDIVSILIGINDTWHRAENQNWMPNDYFEARLLYSAGRIVCSGMYRQGSGRLGRRRRASHSGRSGIHCAA